MPSLFIQFFLFPLFLLADNNAHTLNHDNDQLTITAEDTLTIAEKKTFTSLPFQIPDQQYKPLSSCDDNDLNAALKNALCENGAWRDLIDRKKMSVGVVDIHDPYNPRFAAVNGNEMMYAASLPKIAILLATMDAFEKKELAENEELNADLVNMISHSSNRAASRFIDLVGFEKIASVLTDPQYKLYDKASGGGLWVGKRYAGAGNRYPDPLKGLSHAATAEDVCNFYYLMAMGKLVSPERSTKMLSIMDDPALHHKFVNTLDKIAPDAKLYRKSGTWQTYHSDSVMVWGEGNRKYILVALIEDPAGESIIRSLVNPVERVLQIAGT